MMEPSDGGRGPTLGKRLPLERGLWTLGTAICAGASLVSWHYAFRNQPDRLWPAPAGYFVEMTLLPLVGLAFAWTPSARNRAAILWAITGMTLAFSILAGFSVGFMYLPAALPFALAAASSAGMAKLLRGLLIGAAGAVGQVTLMVALIQLLTR